MDIFSVAQIGTRFAHFMPIYSTPKMPMMLALRAPTVSNMNTTKAIEELQVDLNSTKYARGDIFRRNEIVYPLVCYVNNITGCYISKNYETIVLFIGRARKHMRERPENEKQQGYYSIVTEYLNLMEEFLKENGIDTSYDY